VIGFPQKNFKASLRSEHLLAKIAVVDPLLTLDVRPEITARTGMDALCQCVEAYTSNGAGLMTDPLALEGVLRAGRSLQKAFENGSDLDAREDLSLAALLSGIALTNAGLGAVHGFAAPLGASFPVPHGTVCAALLPGVMSANIAALSAADPRHPYLFRYAQVGRALMREPLLEDRIAMEQGVKFVAQLREALKIPKLRDFGMSQSDVPPMVELARKSSSMRYNPIELRPDVLSDLLAEAIG
jgi:alcohol dehydrogenase class IV